MDLWIANTGEIACGKDGHGGFYLERLVEKDEKVGKHSKEFVTPLEHWMRVPDEDVERFKLTCHSCPGR
jgi:hypothetical protein